ncbi:hypothetical protein EDD30_4264 [Couchioplanes caeruleus]|uniref:Secreted protein n=3 Tax=Couchioplanes caeruleus TaxID=56438 RepID=A0A1K0FBD5_9ACTN|nr:hypothetical protein BG844_34025 [Couchioplanes caeruleus subsp. caeruleus]ROP31365.1 hypothetical protein EDD30_4264 [Couchioplanes caeruleus]
MKTTRAARRFRALAGAVAGTMLGAAVAVMPGTAAHAASCYGGAVGWNSSASHDNVMLPNAITGPNRWTTTSRCGDINFWVDGGTGTFNADVRVCFDRTGCQGSWKQFGTGDAEKWKVIATDVRDGTKFRIEINYRFVPQGGRRYGGKVAF